MMPKSPPTFSSLPKIGLIDSGIGGFSILQAFLEHPKKAHYFYIADSAYLPYGLKSDEEIHQRMEILSRYLIEEIEVDALVIACNTATAISAEKLRRQFPLLPIIGIEPAIKPATLATKSRHIAVAATYATLKSARLNQLIKSFAGDQNHSESITVHKIIGTDWVTLVEKGELSGLNTQAVMERSLAIFKEYPIDQLVLGCTHFPFLTTAIKAVLPPTIELIDPAPAIVKETFNRLPPLSEERESLKASKDSEEAFLMPKLYLFTTGELTPYQKQAKLLKTEGYQLDLLQLPY